MRSSAIACAVSAMTGTDAVRASALSRRVASQPSITGKPMSIQTRPNANRPAHHIELAMNTKTNRAEVTVDDETEDFFFEETVTVDCNDDDSGSGAGIPTVGSDTAPLMVVGGLLMVVGAGLLVGRRLRTA